DLDAVDDAIGRVGDHAVVDLEPLSDLYAQAVALPDLDVRESRALPLDAEHRPAFAMSEHRARGDVHDVLFLPDHDARLHAEAVAEARPLLARRVEVDQHEDALLLDAERARARKGARLDPSHVPLERALAAPPL